MSLFGLKYAAVVAPVPNITIPALSLGDNDSRRIFAEFFAASSRQVHNLGSPCIWPETSITSTTFTPLVYFASSGMCGLANPIIINPIVTKDM